MQKRDVLYSTNRLPLARPASRKTVPIGARYNKTRIAYREFKKLHRQKTFYALHLLCRQLTFLD